MDLQATESMSGKRSPLTTLVTLFCFALACALMIGSLLMPGKLDHRGHTVAPLSSTFVTKTS